MTSDTSRLYNDQPNHMIIWLDHHIGQSGEHKHLKNVFASNINPKNNVPVQLFDRDYNGILRNEDYMPVDFEGVKFFLAAFTNVEQCIECFEQNQDKHILFITSGSLGRTAVPIILERFKHIFTDPVTENAYSSIYVYCHHIEYQMDWALDYTDYLEIFNFDADLLVRMIRDMADYFFMIAKRMLEEDPPNNSAAYQRLSWAHTLYQRYSNMENDPLRKEFNEINELFIYVEEKLKPPSSEEDD